MSRTVSTSDYPSRRRRPSPRQARLDQLRRLTGRDRLLLSWLAEHYVLTTTQIAQALFPSERSARLRLATLAAIDAVTRFVDVTAAGRQHLYTLGPLGMIVEPSCYHHPDRPDARAPRTSLERTERIVGSRTLAHLLGTNQLFIDLIGYTRTDPHARLGRWWSEQHATAAYAAASYATTTAGGVRPDGHGIWHAGGRTVGFFLEHDNGTEFSGGRGPCRSPDLRVSAAQRLTWRRYRARQVWCKRRGGV